MRGDGLFSLTCNAVHSFTNMPGEMEKCEMQNREREMEKANKKWIYEMANEEWKTQNGQRKMENAKWRTGDGE